MGNSNSEVEKAFNETGNKIKNLGNKSIESIYNYGNETIKPQVNHSLGSIYNYSNEIGNTTKNEIVNLGNITKNELVDFGNITKNELVDFGNNTKNELVDFGNKTKNELVGVKRFFDSMFSKKSSENQTKEKGIQIQPEEDLTSGIYLIGGLLVVTAIVLATS